MKRFAALCLTLVLLLGAFVPQQAQADTVTMKVTGGWLRLRSTASFSGSTIASYYTGTTVTVLGTSGAWYHVRTPDNKTGYMYGSYLTANTTSAGSTTSVTAYVTSSNGKGVRLRTGPGTSYSVITQCAVGTQVTILSAGTYWHYISVNGQKGYMMADYLTTTAPSTTPSTSDTAYTAYVTSSNGKNVRMRSGAGTGYTTIASYAVGTQVTVLSTSGSWSRISVSGKTGYMMSQYLTTTAPSTGSSEFVSYTGYVTSSNGKGVNLRAIAASGSQVLGQYPVGTQVTVLGQVGSWYRVDISGVKGYMMSQFVTTNTTSGSTTSSYTAYVTSSNGNGVYLRSGAGKSYASIGIYAVGTQVTVLQHNTTWDYIRIGTREGYMMNQYLTTTAPGTQAVTGVILSNANPVPGETLWANVTPSGANVTYEWMTDNGLLLATTATLTLKDDDVGLRIRLRVTGANGYSGSATSAYATVQSATASATPITGTVSLNYSAALPGVTLRPTVDVNCANITYHWYAGGVEVSTGSTLTITNDMSGKAITLVVMPATGSGYSGQVESNVCTVLTTDVATKTDL